MGLLIRRGRIHVDHGILGSSDLDQEIGLSAKLKVRLITKALCSIFQKGRLPSWCVWIVPGILFGAAHTLIPLAKFGASTLLPGLLSGVAGYALASCGFYALRRWSGTIWLPVFIHAALDFTGILV